MSKKDKVGEKDPKETFRATIVRAAAGVSVWKKSVYDFPKHEIENFKKTPRKQQSRKK